MCTGMCIYVLYGMDQGHALWIFVDVQLDYIDTFHFESYLCKWLMPA